MRVIAGRLKGRRLHGPRWEGLRPTSDRLKESLFEILSARWPGAVVLDGFAGTGALGIEALSRGAAHVTFVERERRAAALIERNLAACRIAGGYSIVVSAVEAARDSLAGRRFDVVLLDPPYAIPDLAKVVREAASWMSPGAVLVLEHAERHAPPPTVGDLSATRTVRAGDSALTFYVETAPPPERASLPASAMPDGRARGGNAGCDG